MKIGDFGIAKQLNNANQYAKTQAGTMLYMAPEIINGVKYNNKVGIWSLGCIIHELSSLNYCFECPSINGLISKIVECKHEKINQNIYGANLIDLLLNKDYKKRPNIEEVIKILNKNIGSAFLDKILELFEEDEAYQNYIIEKNIQNSIDQVNFTVLSRELKMSKVKYYAGLALIGIPLNLAVAIATGGLSLIESLGIGAGIGGGLGIALLKIDLKSY